ncbi:MAG: aromatic ring-hydroxylating dioxygenase subunit alpha [Ginsengibacter sp.]
MSFNNTYQPVALSRDIPHKKPVRAWYQNKPVVLFRNNKLVAAYDDYCPHRGAPLSEGFIRGEQIHCAYHGWRFDCKSGFNTFSPVKNAPIDCKLKPVYVVEKYNIIWLSHDETASLPGLINDIPSIITSGLIKAKAANIVENFLEGSHTHYVHDGWVRSKGHTRQQINAEMVPAPDGFKVYYSPEKARGFLTRLLPGKYQLLTPVTTYIYPGTTILEYFNQERKLISRFEGIISESENACIFFARIFMNFGVASALVAFFSKFFFHKIIAQDIKILEMQDRNLKYYPDRKFISDETDVVGQQIFAWLYDRSKIVPGPLHFKVFW